jgi:ferritin-like metal-binding protein YciE
MAQNTAQEHIDDYLSDAHSIEEQALVQMKRASKIAGDPGLAQAFAEHERETEEHERLIRERLAAHDGKPSAIKEAVMKAGGVAFVLFAQANPDTPGKLTAHGYSYEHLEIGSYELLARVAQRAGDQETVAVAQRILAQERAMARRLEEHFDEAADASLRDLDPDDLTKQVAKYLADAHALETQAISLLEGGKKIVGDDQLAALMDQHLAETREHERLVTERLEALGESSSKLKDAALGMGGLNWGGFFAAHPDTPGKLAAFAYAFEHLEIAGYELLKRVAQRAGDTETVALAERILRDERGAADKIAAQFDHAAEAALAAQSSD